MQRWHMERVSIVGGVLLVNGGFPSIYMRLRFQRSSIKRLRFLAANDGRYWFRDTGRSQFPIQRHLVARVS